VRADQALRLHARQGLDSERARQGDQRAIDSVARQQRGAARRPLALEVDC
jgi:hypothetical protein